MRSTAMLLGDVRDQKVYLGGGEGRVKAEKSPEVLSRYQLPGGQDRALRGSVIAGIPQT